MALLFQVKVLVLLRIIYTYKLDIYFTWWTMVIWFNGSTDVAGLTYSGHPTCVETISIKYLFLRRTEGGLVQRVDGRGGADR